MFQSSGLFHEQFNALQSQFQQWRTLEQIYAIVELSKKVQISNRYFLFQYFQNLIDLENNEMFSHTVDEANSPEVVACQRTRGFEKLSLTLQLFLPLVGQKRLSKELIEAYRQNLLSFDAALASTAMLNDNEQNLQLLCQKIYFYLSNNAALNCLIAELPHLVRMVEKNPVTTHRPLQRNPSIRPEQGNFLAPLMTCSSEGSQSAFSPSTLQPSLKHHETKDSGVDLTDNSFNNSWRTSPSPSDSTSPNARPFLSHGNTSNELNPMDSRHMPLMAVFSAPSYSDQHSFRNPVRRSLKIKTTLAKSDEEEETNQNQTTPSKDSSQEKNTSDQNSMINNRRVKQFNSLRYVGTDRLSPGSDNVSQYLDVDSAATKYSLVQWKPGMKNIPLWLKYLRLHKYTEHFCQMSYDEMMNLTKENLKALNITNGACAKILLNIQKLKTRGLTLRQALDEFDRGQIDLMKLFQIVNEVALTPILPRSDEQEDLPSLITEALEKVCQNLDVATSPEIGHDLINIFDVCYRHEAFTDQQRHVILQRRGRLSNSLQHVPRPEHRSVNLALTAHASQPRRYMKSTVRAIKSLSGVHHIDYLNPSGGFQTNSSALMGPASMRHFNKSSTQNYSLNTEFNENNSNASAMQPNGAYLVNHQHPTLVRKPSINPYGENHPQKTKLCKTFSEPYTTASFNDHLVPASVYRNASNSTPYSQQQFPVRMRLPLNVTQQTNSFSTQHPQSNYFDPSNDNTDQDSTEEQRQNSQEFESLCRQITESALSDDEHQREASSHSSSTHSADSEQ